MSFCSNCGNKLEENSQFCGKCGAVVETNSTNIEEQPNQEVKEKKKKFPVLIGCIVAIVLLAVGVIVYSKFFSLPEHGKKTESTQEKVQKEVNDKKKFLLIKEVTENTKYSSTSSTEYEYDSEGNLTSLTMYSGDTVRQASKWTRDENGSVEIYEQYDGQGEVEIRTEIIHNKEEQPLSQKSYDSTGALTGYYEYIYDSQGNCTNEKGYDGTGKLTENTVNVFDADGNQLSSIHYGENGEIVNGGYVEWQYDEKGNQIKYSWYGEDKILKYYYEQTFDDKGNILTRNRYSGEGNLTEQQIFQYASDGKWTKCQFYNGKGETSGYQEALYDAHGNMTSSKWFKENGELVMGYQELTYDEYGNKITCKNYDTSGELHDITTYTYEEMTKTK